MSLFKLLNKSLNLLLWICLCQATWITESSKLSLSAMSLDSRQPSHPFKVFKAATTSITWDSPKSPSADGLIVTGTSLALGWQTIRIKALMLWVRQDMSGKPSTCRQQLSKESSFTRRTRSTFEASKSSTAMVLQNWLIHLRAQKLERLSSKKAMYSSDLPLFLWATMTLNPGSSDSLSCATARSTKLILLATALALNKHGLRSEVYKAVKMLQARELERLLSVDGVTQTPILLVANWQITEANNPICLACQGTLCNLSHYSSSPLQTSRSLERTMMATWEALESPIATDRLIWLVQTMASNLALSTLKRATFSLD